MRNSDTHRNLNHGKHTIDVIVPPGDISNGRHANWDLELLAVIFKSGPEPKIERGGLDWRGRWSDRKAQNTSRRLGTVKEELAYPTCRRGRAGW